MFALVLHVLFSNPAFILHVMWFKLFIIIFRRWRSCLQTAPLFAIVTVNAFHSTPRISRLDLLGTGVYVCFSYRGDAKVTRIFTHARVGFEHTISDPHVLSPSSLFSLSLHDLRHMTWERSLLSQGNGNGNGNTGVN